MANLVPRMCPLWSLNGSVEHLVPKLYLLWSRNGPVAGLASTMYLLWSLNGPVANLVPRMYPIIRKSAPLRAPIDLDLCARALLLTPGTRQSSMPAKFVHGLHISHRCSDRVRILIRLFINQPLCQPMGGRTRTQYPSSGVPRGAGETPAVRGCPHVVQTRSFCASTTAPQKRAAGTGGVMA